MRKTSIAYLIILLVFMLAMFGGYKLGKYQKRQIDIYINCVQQLRDDCS